MQVLTSCRSGLGRTCELDVRPKPDPREECVKKQPVADLAEVFRKAQRHLARRDPVLKRLIATVGPCTLTHRSDRFASLARSIVSQQISVKAAASILARLEATLLPQDLLPAAVLALSEEQLRGAGLSGAKTRYLRNLAEHVHAGTVPLDELHTLPDEEVIGRLLPVKGIGRWTAKCS